MLQGLAEIPTTASAVSYAGGNFGPAGTVEGTLDDMGDAIIRGIANTVYYESANREAKWGSVLRWYFDHE